MKIKDEQTFVSFGQPKSVFAGRVLVCVSVCGRVLVLCLLCVCASTVSNNNNH